MTNPPVIARRQLRLAAVEALSLLEASNAVSLLDSPGVWPSQPENMPAVLVRATRTGKEAISRSTTNFTGTVTIEIEARVRGSTAEAAQDAIELLDAQVEQALLTNTAFVAMAQQISIEAETEVTAEGTTYIASTRMQLRCEVAETFDPIDDAPEALQPVAPPLEGVDLHADLRNIYDPTGTYGESLFADAIQPAPRQSGPDGRDEGAVQFNFTTST